MTESTMTVKRPGVITLIVIYLWVVAIGALLTGAAFVFGSTSDEVIAEVGRTKTELLWTGVAELVLGVLIVLVAIALMNGAPGARTLVAIVMMLRIAATVFIVATNHTSAYLLVGVLHVLLPLFVLWAMYGNDRSEAYFEAHAR